jgi:Carboxylesterase family
MAIIMLHIIRSSPQTLLEFVLINSLPFLIMSIIALRTLICFVLCILPTHARPTNPQPSATIHAGVVVGTTTSLPHSTVVVNKFLGIPFAVPPQRFAPPMPPTPWTTPLQTVKNAPACIQQFDSKSFQI